MFRSLCLLVAVLSDPTLCRPILGLTVSSSGNSLLPRTIQDTVDDTHASKLGRFSALVTRAIVPDTRAISSLLTRTATACSSLCRDPRGFCRRRAPRPESQKSDNRGLPASSRTSIPAQDPADADLAARGRALKLALSDFSKNRPPANASRFDQAAPSAALGLAAPGSTGSGGSAALSSGKRAAATTTTSNSPNDGNRHALLDWTTRSSTSSSGRPSVPSVPGSAADVLEEQNAGLIEAMHARVGMLRNVATEIGREIKDSNALVESMGPSVDKGKETLKQMARTVGGWMGRQT